MSHSFEPAIVRSWLEPLGLNLAALVGQTATRQAQILHFCQPPEGNPISSEERAGLLLLAWATADRSLAESNYRTVLLAAFDLCLTIGETEMAQYLFERVYPEPTEKATYFENLIDLRLGQDRREEAQVALGEMQELHGESFLKNTTEGHFWLHIGEPGRAAQAYRRALESSPTSQRVLLSLAQCAIEMGQPDAARQRLLEFDETPRGWWKSLGHAARLWRLLGDDEQADRKERACAEARQQQQAKIAGTVEAIDTQAEATAITNDASLELLPELTSPTEGTGLPPEAFQVLQEVFGHARFRPGQEQVIDQVLAGRDTLAVLPTGAGKSLCYQVPALLLSRPVLVLSPLISLMKDQFDKLPPALKGQTLVINSGLEPGEAARRLREVARPGSPVRLIYAAPERLRQRPFVQSLERAKLGLLVVDEAHCVTMWGNDFRPDYLFIRRVLADIATPVLAVTATATPDIAGEIGRQLGRELALVRGSVFRSNLQLGVERLSGGGQERYRQVAEVCAGLEGSGIIYTRSRDKCDELAGYLRQRGISALAYHAGLDNGDRQAAQEKWSRGETQVIVATIAFGMGIDKPDVRYIIHLSPPTSLENYTQEAGRAGRDGLPSQCLMLYTSSDKGNLTRWQREERERLDLAALRAIYRTITRQVGRARQGVVPLMDLLLEVSEAISDPDETMLRVGLSILERADLLERGYDLPTMASVSLNMFGSDNATESDLAAFFEAVKFGEAGSAQIDLVEIAGRLDWQPADLELRLLGWAERGLLDYRPARREPYIVLKEAGNDARARLESLLEQMRVAAEQRLDHLETYLKSRTCRQVLIARHFGERLTAPCGQCDNCLNKDRPRQPVTTTARPALAIKPNLPETTLTEAILGAIQGAGYPPSRSALPRILLGSEKATPTERHNPLWEKLASQVTQKKVLTHLDELIGQKLVAVGKSETAFRGQTYEIYSLSEAGREWLDQHDPSQDDHNDEPAAPKPTTQPVTAFDRPARSSEIAIAAKSAKISPDEATRLVLECLNFLSPQGEAQVGRTGLVRLLLGQPSALGTRANNAYKGSLEGRLKQKEVENLVERLVETGLIAEQAATGPTGISYRALRLDEAGYSWLDEEGSKIGTES